MVDHKKNLALDGTHLERKDRERHALLFEISVNERTRETK